MAASITTPPPTAEARTTASPPGRPPAAVALLAALTGAAGYAAFAGGAVRQEDAVWLEAGLVLVALFAAAAWLGPRALRPSASPLALAGLGLLAVYAAWVGASLLWSVAPSDTWAELNRVLAYVLVVALAIAGASTAPRAIERVAIGWLAIATVIALYALGGKVFPGIFDHALEVTRLREPLEYASALGLACALAVPIAMRAATDRASAARWRIAALLALLVLLCCLGLTESVEAIVALVVAVVVVTAVRGPRLEGLGAFALAALAAAPVIAVALTEEALSDPGIALSRRIDAGLLLGLVLVGCAALLAVLGRLAIRAEPRVRWTSARNTRTWGVLGALLAALVCAAIALAATSDGGLRGALDRAGDDLRDVGAEATAPGAQPATGGDRWGWWQEAFGAFADEPVLGWGADGFEVSRRLYRVTPGDTGRAHSVPLQLMADTGAIGRGARARRPARAGRRGRAAAAQRSRRAASGRSAARCSPRRRRGAAHALVDWDWAIPGVTVPALLFLGVLCARRPAPEPVPSAYGLPREESSAGRFAALVACSLLLCAALASAILPAWSQERTDRALELAREPTPERLEDAAATAAPGVAARPARRAPALRRGGIDQAPRPRDRRAHAPARCRRPPAVERRGVDAAGARRRSCSPTARASFAPPAARPSSTRGTRRRSASPARCSSWRRRRSPRRPRWGRRCRWRPR